MRRETGNEQTGLVPNPLFSAFRMSVWPPWSHATDETMAGVFRWISRALWLLSLAGLALAWRERMARWIWLLPVCGLVGVHLFTVCNPRYLTPLLPLLVPYGGLALVRLARLVRRGAGVHPPPPE
jgi:hypothetical protein